MIQSYFYFRSMKSLQSIAEQILVGMISNLWNILVMDVLHGGNDT